MTLLFTYFVRCYFLQFLSCCCFCYLIYKSHIFFKWVFYDRRDGNFFIIIYLFIYLDTALYFFLYKFSVADTTTTIKCFHSFRSLYFRLSFPNVTILYDVKSDKFSKNYWFWKKYIWTFSLFLKTVRELPSLEMTH